MDFPESVQGTPFEATRSLDLAAMSVQTVDAYGRAIDNLLAEGTKLGMHIVPRSIDAVRLDLLSAGTLAYVANESSETLDLLHIRRQLAMALPPSFVDSVPATVETTVANNLKEPSPEVASQFGVIVGHGALYREYSALLDELAAQTGVAPGRRYRFLLRIAASADSILMPADPAQIGSAKALRAAMRPLVGMQIPLAPITFNDWVPRSSRTA